MVKLKRYMLSLVIPVKDEEEGLQALYDALMAAVPDSEKEYEIIFIDDGSTDHSLEILKHLHEKNNHIRVFSFRRNRGKADALSYGFAKAKGDVVVTMDADLQDKPSELSKFLEKYHNGAEVVCGWRKERKDKSRMVVISHLFNSLIGFLFGLPIHDIDCGFKLFSQEAAKSVHVYGGLYRFIPLLLFQQGFVVDEVAVEHDIRKFGHSKYGFSKVWKNLPDLFTMLFLVKYGKRPLHFFGIIGFFFSLIGILIVLYFAILHTFYHSNVGGRPLLYIGILLVIAGLQVFFTGFLADLMINIAHTPEYLDDRQMHFPVKYTSDHKS